MPTVIGDKGEVPWEPADDPILRDSVRRGVPDDVVFRFLAAWKQYPARRGGNPRRMALKAWVARVKAKEATPDQLYRATVNYRAHCVKGEAIGTPYVMHGATFYGPNERWRDFLDAPDDDQPADEVMAEIRNTWLRGNKP